ncbi:MAG: hypothetical protein ACOC1D_04925, partial [Prolixibacteraceae bacterium]
SSEYSGCQNDIVCTDYGNWGREAKPIGYIGILYRYNNQDLISKCTCFFVYKEEGYTRTDYQSKYAGTYTVNNSNIQFNTELY